VFFNSSGPRASASATLSVQLFSRLSQRQTRGGSERGGGTRPLARRRTSALHNQQLTRYLHALCVMRYRLFLCADFK
jgi:hypothetical protein